MTQKRILNISHRGAAALAIENSLEAVKIAIESPANIIELDIRTTKDGIPVVYHDLSLKKFFGTGKIIKRTNFADIKRLKTSYLGYRVPTLDEVLDMVKEKNDILLDIKDHYSVDRIVKAITERKMTDTVYFFSHNAKVVLRAQTLNSNLKTGLVFHALGVRYPRMDILTNPIRSVLYLIYFLKYFKAINPHFLHLPIIFIKKSIIEYCHQRDIKVFSWNVKTEAQINKLIALGIDGIVHDDPYFLDKILARYK